MSIIIQVLLADDHPFVRLGIRAALMETEDIEVVGEATNGASILPHCRRLLPQVLLLDLSMPDFDPVATIESLRGELPEIRVIILSAHNTAFYVQRMIEVDVAGYVLKDEAPEYVEQAIRAAMRGEIWYSQSVVQQILALRRTSLACNSIPLNLRERQILALLAKGKSNIQIAAELHLAEQTIKNYLQNIYRVLNVSARAEAIVWAINNNLSSYISL